MPTTRSNLEDAPAAVEEESRNKFADYLSDEEDSNQVIKENNIDHLRQV